MLQRYNICTEQLSAKILMMANSKMYSLLGYGKVIQDLVDATTNEEVTDEALIKLPKLANVTYNSKNVITSFSK